MGIKGITVVLIDKEKIGTDKFNRPIYEEKKYPLIMFLLLLQIPKTSRLQLI